MWRASEFTEDLDYVADHVTDDEALIEELQATQANLHRDKAYMNREYRGDTLAYMGLVTNDTGYVLAEEESDRGPITNYYVLSFEKERNGRKEFLQPRDALRMETFQDDDVPGTNAARLATWDFCWRVLKQLSDTPDADMQDLNPSYTPPRYR